MWTKIIGCMVCFVILIGGVSCSVKYFVDDSIKDIQRNGETGVALKAQPYEMTGTIEGRAILFVHGFSGNPNELRPLAECLNKKGYTVKSVLLPGHGINPEALATVTPQQWRDTVRDAYLALKKRYEKVFYVGISTGGTLGFDLATEVDVDALVLIAPYFKVTHKWYYVLPPEFYAKYLSWLVDYLPSVKSDVIRDPEGQKKHFTFKFVSTKAIRRVVRYVESVKTKLDKVTTPTLIIHSRKDHAVDPKGSQMAFNAISSDEKYLIWYKESGHLIPMDYEKDQLCAEVFHFLENR